MMNIVGITACTAGIAHTYMAQAAIEKYAKEMGYDCKIETQGAMGVENELTDEEIEKADIVIIGADIVVEGIERFEEKEKIYQTSVAACVSNPQQVIEKAIAI